MIAAALSLLILAPVRALPEAERDHAEPAAQVRELPGQSVELKTRDGWALKARYQPAAKDQRTLILLHGKGQRKEIWRALMLNLAKTGFGFLAPDLRGHGESQTGPDGKPANYRQFKAGKAENDYASMALDVQAAADYLAAQGVPESSVGLVGTDLGGVVAIRYAAVHPKIPYVVMLSPAMEYQDVPSVNAIRQYKGRPILLIYSELDRRAASNAPLLYEFARRSAGESNAGLVSVPKVHGVKLPANGSVIRQIVDWLILPVKPEAPAVSTGAAAGASQP